MKYTIIKMYVSCIIQIIKCKLIRRYIIIRMKRALWFYDKFEAFEDYDNRNEMWAIYLEDRKLIMELNEQIITFQHIKTQLKEQVI